MRPDERGVPAVRAADADRDRAVAQLRAHCAEGRLTLDELSDRVEAALAARTVGELELSLADLPPAPRDTRRQRGARFIVAIFGANRRRARWFVGPRSTAVAVFGACWLDLRQAAIEGDELVVTATAVFGTVKVIVPSGVDVDITGVPVFGTKTDQVAGSRPQADRPVVRVRGFPVFGSVRVLDREPIEGV